jgi:hypothetical protein
MSRDHAAPRYFRVDEFPFRSNCLVGKRPGLVCTVKASCVPNTVLRLERVTPGATLRGVLPERRLRFLGGAGERDGSASTPSIVSRRPSNRPACSALACQNAIRRMNWGSMIPRNSPSSRNEFSSVTSRKSPVYDSPWTDRGDQRLHE